MVKHPAPLLLILTLTLLFPNWTQSSAVCREKQNFPIKVQGPSTDFDGTTKKACKPLKAKGAAHKPKDISLEQFEGEVLQSPIPVVAYYWFETCEPCRHMAPAIKQLAIEFQGRIKFVKINADDNDSEAIRKLGIDGFPTLQFYKKGQLLGASGSVGLSWDQNHKKLRPIMRALLKKDAASLLPNLLKSADAKLSIQSFDITEDQFKSAVLDAPVPVLVEIWAPGDSYHRVHPLVKKLAKEYVGRITYFRMEAKGASDPSQFPILHFVNNKKHFGMLSGETEITEAAVREKLEALIKATKATFSAPKQP